MPCSIYSICNIYFYYDLTEKEESNHVMIVIFYEVGRFWTSNIPVFIQSNEHQHFTFSQEVVDKSGIQDGSCSEYKYEEYMVNL
jgi:hypothetical protein